jgi:hypothetical protein
VPVGLGIIIRVIYRILELEPGPTGAMNNRQWRRPEFQSQIDYQGAVALMSFASVSGSIDIST